MYEINARLHTYTHTFPTEYACIFYVHFVMCMCLHAYGIWFLLPLFFRILLLYPKSLVFVLLLVGITHNADHLVIARECCLGNYSKAAYERPYHCI